MSRNYIDLDYDGQFDVATLINREFGALTPDERRAVIRAVARALKPGGYFAFDTLSLAYLERRIHEGTSCYVSPPTGFWAEGPQCRRVRSSLDVEAPRVMTLSSSPR